MARDFSNPNAQFVEVTPEMEAKERSRSKPVGGGLFASWNSPPEELDPSLIPEEKRELLLKSQKAQPKIVDESVPLPIRKPIGSSIYVPPQALPKLKSLLTTFDGLTVCFSPEQAQTFLDAIQSMPTPKVMSDAKAIIKLCDELERMT